MSIRCAFGMHDWKPILRVREKPVTKWYEILVVPSLFAGPPFKAPIFPYQSHHECVGYQCRRCATRKRS